ncbi:MAG: class I SAM-dependent methyltransferase [Calothrix sp. FI2-JRJ7]|jgi:SAM-dependent methyltransferase|nr:class I SAM-dependent methyltransferase [Calothrix sp. FI2-JRJ7]
MIKQEEYLKKLYLNRFSHKDIKYKLKLWKVLTDSFLQKYIKSNYAVLDIGGGYCEFINQVKAKDKYLIDLNPDSNKFANSDVDVINIDILTIDMHKNILKSFDVIFISNFFEHLGNKEELIKVLLFCFDHLKTGGSLLVIQPNFKYSFREYFDFIDHQLPITHISLQEVMKTVGFSIDTVIPRFLPFSTKGRPTSPFLLKIYLKLPFLWSFLGAQMFIKAIKPVENI